MSWILDALKAIQIKARFLFGIWFFGLIVLALPQGAAVFLGIDELRVQYRPYIGIAMIAAFCFWVVQIWPVYLKHRERLKRKKRILNHLATLNPNEKRILQYCLEHNCRTIYLNLIAHPECPGLVQKGIMLPPTGIYSVMEAPYTVSDIAWELLKHMKAKEKDT